ncbi:MAG TPA: hypothetical protein PLB32_25375 [Acidobacteriota bacterium]|nr:hypothetical protein [Acidobacteriota bacterium]
MGKAGRLRSCAFQLPGFPLRNYDARQKTSPGDCRQARLGTENCIGRSTDRILWTKKNFVIEAKIFMELPVTTVRGITKSEPQSRPMLVAPAMCWMVIQLARFLT